MTTRIDSLWPTTRPNADGTPHTAQGHMAEAKRIGLLVFDITAHKQAFYRACNRCRVPMQAMSEVIAAFDQLESGEVT